ncbi:FAD-dependent catabolic D-arginine dehydrogenase DauA [Allostella vacuolata]|nr:FAD-dependent catabolic D-arginine dehydrogenase DauA [Stella vacuolata]
MDRDVIILGGGMAGLSAAYFLSQHASVLLLERETALGYHSSGRSAAQFTVGISAPTMRRLAQASRSFLEAPPDGFAAAPILSPRGSMTVAPAGQEAKLHRQHAMLAEAGAGARLLDATEALALFPALDPAQVAAGVFEASAMDIDVDLLLQGFARGARAQGAMIATDSRIEAIERRSGRWTVRTDAATFSAPLLLNAAGAWVDQVADMAGRAPIGITPCRRTAFTFAPPPGMDTDRWPHVNSVAHDWYVKPETGRLMGSLSDQTPTEPCDAQPDDLDVAQGIYNIEQATRFTIARPLSRWAGLRSFVADRSPVAGAGGRVTRASSGWPARAAAAS